MDLIYAQAYFTIIAPEGDAYQGLPGVNGFSRCTPTFLTLGNINMRLITDPLDGLYRGNWVWTKRAWTYQEGCVSRRKVFFTQHGVIFWCGPMYRVEGLHCPSLHSDNARNDSIDWQLKIVVPHARTSSHHVAKDVLDLVIHYLGRDLSCEDDALNACLGVLNSFDTTHYWGVPVLNYDYKEESVLALHWRNRNVDKERCNFPTWSWTRWKSTILWDEYPKKEWFSSIISIMIQLPDMQWCNILQGCPYRGNLGRVACGKTLRITGYTVEYQYDPMDATVVSVSDLSGKKFWLDFGFDSKEIPTCRTMAGVTMLELQQLCSSTPEPEGHRIVVTYSAMFLLLRKQGENYQRVGLARAWDKVALFDAGQEAFLNHIELKARSIKTFYII